VVANGYTSASIAVISASSVIVLLCLVTIAVVVVRRFACEWNCILIVVDLTNSQIGKSDDMTKSKRKSIVQFMQ